METIEKRVENYYEIINKKVIDLDKTDEIYNNLIKDLNADIDVSIILSDELDYDKYSKLKEELKTTNKQIIKDRQTIEEAISDIASGKMSVKDDELNIYDNYFKKYKSSNISELNKYIYPILEQNLKKIKNIRVMIIKIMKKLIIIKIMKTKKIQQLKM